MTGTCPGEIIEDDLWTHIYVSGSGARSESPHENSTREIRHVWSLLLRLLNAPPRVWHTRANVSKKFWGNEPCNLVVLTEALQSWEWTEIMKQLNALTMPRPFLIRLWEIFTDGRMQFFFRFFTQNMRVPIFSPQWQPCRSATWSALQRGCVTSCSFPTHLSPLCGCFILLIWSQAPFPQSLPFCSHVSRISQVFSSHKCKHTADTTPAT